MDQSAEQTVLCAVFAVVAGAGHDHVVAFNSYGEIGVEFLAEFAIFAFDGHDVVLVINRYGYSSGDFDGSFTNS